MCVNETHVGPVLCHGVVLMLVLVCWPLVHDMWGPLPLVMSMSVLMYGPVWYGGVCGELILGVVGVRRGHEGQHC